jgi:Mn-dependent DtxR family transcriptional regulator
MHFEPDSNKARALAFLAADDTVGYRPSEIASRTEIAEGSATKTMQRLREAGYVASIDSYYFIPQEEVQKVRRILTDSHAMKHLRKHVEGEVEWDDVDDDVADEAAALVDDVAAEQSQPNGSAGE